MESAEQEKKRKLSTEESDGLKVKRIKDTNGSGGKESPSDSQSNNSVQDIRTNQVHIKTAACEQAKDTSVSLSRVLSDGEITDSSSDSVYPSVNSPPTKSNPTSLSLPKSIPINPSTSQSAAEKSPPEQVAAVKSPQLKCPKMADSSAGDIMTSREMEEGELSDEDYDLEMDDEAHRLLEELSEKASPQPLESKLEGDEKISDGGETRVRLLLKEMIPLSQLNILPADWREIPHESGIKLYIHIPTRVLTTTRPWQIPSRTFQAKASNIPLNAIPCLAYRRAREMYENKTEGDRPAEKSQSAPNLTTEVSEDMIPTQTVTESVSESQTNARPSLANTIENKELTEYCKKVFIFNEVSYKHFGDWKERRDRKRMLKEQETEEKMLSLVDDPDHLIRIPITHLPECDQRDDKERLRRDLILNPVRGYTELVRQYFMWASKTTLDIETKKDGVQFESIVKAGEMKYATCRGDTKRAARDGACQIALSVVVPAELMDKLEEAKKERKNTGDKCSSIRIFESMPVTDPRVPQLSKEVGQVNPHQILKRCIKMNLALDDDAIRLDTIIHKNKMYNKVELKMSVGELTSTVTCKNSKLGQQMTAQDILQKLHPHVRSWAAMLKMYGDSAVGNIEYQTRIKDAGVQTEMDDEVPVTVKLEPEPMDIKPLMSIPIECLLKTEPPCPRTTFDIPMKLDKSVEAIVPCKVSQSQTNVGHRDMDTYMAEKNCQFITTEVQTEIEMQEMVEITDSIRKSLHNIEIQASMQSASRQKRTIEVQTDLGGMNAFFCPKRTEPTFTLEEGMPARSIHNGGLIMLTHNSSQTTGLGFSLYHKATQAPEMSYNPYSNRNVVKTYDSVMVSPTVTPTKSTHQPAATQTDMAGYLTYHKATQFPDKEYRDPGHLPAALLNPAAAAAAQAAQELQLLAQLSQQQQQQQQQQLLFQQQLQMSQAGQQTQQQYYIDPSTGIPYAIPAYNPYGGF